MVDFYKAAIIVAGIGACAMGLYPIGLPFIGIGLFLFVALKPVDNAFDAATEEGNQTKQVAAMGLGGLVFGIAVAAFALILISYAKN